MEWHKIKIERKPKKMTRRLRKNVESSFLHILVQGVNKEFIFLENKDIEKYQSLLFKIKKEYELKIVAYCIMHNHAHILLYAEENKTLSKFMHIVNTYYANYYNKKYARVGHVFRDRFKSEEISTKEYLYNCINYIHRNPVKAGLCSSESEYEFSSFNKYKEKYEIFCCIANSEKLFIDTLEDRKQTCEEILDIFL